MSVSKNEHIVYNGPIPNLFSWKECKSLGEVILNRLKELDDCVLLIDGLTSKELTAHQLYTNTIRLVQCLQKFGIKSGDTISFYSENRFEFVPLFLASVCLGVTLGLTFVDYTDEEYKNTVSLLKPRIIFSSPTVIDKIVKLARVYHVEKVIIYDEQQTIYDDVITFGEFFNDSDIENDGNIAFEDKDQWDYVAAIIRTSGTTSFPKSVQLTQMNLLCSLLEYRKRKITPNPLVFSALPWVRPFGFRLLIRQIMHNIKTIFLPKFDERNFLEAIQKFKPNTVNLYVTSLDFLAKNPLTREYDLSSIKVLFSCSAALDKRLKHLVFRKFGIPIIHQGYGMSELSSIADQDDNYHKEESVGLLRKGIFGKVVDLRTKKSVGPNEKGELLFKGPNVMKEYLHNEAATKRTIDEDGWLHTGDYGYFDEDNELFLIDRLKDLIRFKDHLILPAEIESVLRQHSEIDDAGVIGVHDNDAGQVPFAFIVRKDEKITPKEIMDFIAAKCPPEKQIYGIVFIEKIPGDGVGKPSRLLLRQFAKERGIII